MERDVGLVVLELLKRFSALVSILLLTASATMFILHKRIAMSLLIRNGLVVTGAAQGIGDVLCVGEKIVAVGDRLDAPSGVEVVDATGKYIFPGFIDPHTHIHLPFMGTLAKDTYETGTRAALVGGTTTIFDMCCPGRDTPHWDGYREWRNRAEGRACCDYSFHMGVTHFDRASSPGELRRIVEEGVSSFKVFLAYKGALGIDDEALAQTLSLARELGVVTAAHCENETLVSELQGALLRAGRTGPEAHHDSRPPRVEAEGVHHLMTFAEMMRAPVYIVHLSCREALEEALRARARGVSVRIETLIQYLTLSKTHAEQPAFEGAKFVMSPPLRDAANHDALWNALEQGLVDTVATDHAPFDFATQKRMGEGDFTKIPNGIPALEDRINLLHTQGVLTGKIRLSTLVNVASTNPAKIFGLYPRKGTVQPGADADLVVYDPGARGIISARTQQMNVDYSAFEGWETCGRPELVTLRGRVVVRDGHHVGTPGDGQFLRRPAQPPRFS